MNQPTDGPWWRSTSGLITLAAIGAAALYLAFVHIDHVAKVLPLLFILACPLMHIFMHRGHGGHRHGREGHGREEHGREEHGSGSHQHHNRAEDVARPDADETQSKDRSQ